MTIRLCDDPLSGSCCKVRLMPGFPGLDYERLQIDFCPGRQHRSPDLLEINPLGQLPVLEDGGLRLREAQAILCHLANRYDASGLGCPATRRASRR